jgi:hypothetical protein
MLLNAEWLKKKNTQIKANITQFLHIYYSKLMWEILTEIVWIFHILLEFFQD